MLRLRACGGRRGGAAGGGGAAPRPAPTLLGREPRPTAIFAANIRLAIGALAATRRLGLSVPQDVSIVGLGDTPLAAFLEPPLTTVRMPLAELGELAGGSLLGGIEGRG